jgi:hypothetical protein
MLLRASTEIPFGPSIWQIPAIPHMVSAYDIQAIGAGSIGRTRGIESRSAKEDGGEAAASERSSYTKSCSSTGEEALKEA